ncbi:flavodoxin, partial [Vibrio parahaemolyticus]
MFRWALIVLFILFVLLMVVALVVTQIENSQYRKHKQKQQHLQHSLTGESKTAIVVFSRSGNTATLSEHIANKTNGHVYEIFAKSYELGIPGWISALKDARSNVAEIVPQHIDLSSYDTVYLGSPIWLYSPA